MVKQIASQANKVRLRSKGSAFVTRKQTKVEQVYNLKYHEDAEQYFDLLAMMNAQKIKFKVRNNGSLRVIEVDGQHSHLFEQNTPNVNILKPVELMMQA
mgnify:FL=1